MDDPSAFLTSVEGAFRNVDDEARLIILRDELFDWERRIQSRTLPSGPLPAIYRMTVDWRGSRPLRLVLRYAVASSPASSAVRRLGPPRAV